MRKNRPQGVICKQRGMPKLKTNRAMKHYSTLLLAAQYGPWIRCTNATVAFSTRWLTAWLRIIKSLKTCCKTHFWLYGDVPPPIHLNQVQYEAGLFRSCITEPLTIYAVCTVVQQFKKRL